MSLIGEGVGPICERKTYPGPDSAPPTKVVSFPWLVVVLACVADITDVNSWFLKVRLVKLFTWR